MKPNLFLTAILFCLLFVACSDDNGLDFDYPEFTKHNTVGFTVRTTQKRAIEVGLTGQNIAIDWGDGTIEGYNTDYKPITHQYRSSGTFEVKIWSENILQLNVSGLVQPIYNLHIGDCPKLDRLHINTIPDVESFSFGNCPALEYLNLGNWESLVSLDLSGCPNLVDVYCYTHPDLVSIDLSGNKTLNDLRITGTALKSLLLEDNNELTFLSCEDNKLENIIVSDKNIIATIECSDNEFNVFNLSAFPQLKELLFNNNKISAIQGTENNKVSALHIGGNELESFDFSEFPNLTNLECQNNKFSVLDLTDCPQILELNCSENELTEIALPAGNDMRLVNCVSNKLNKEMLNKLFTDLPEAQVKYPGTSQGGTSRYSKIQFSDNPGTEDCDTEIIADKGWMIIEGN